MTTIRAMTGKDLDRAFGVSEAIARYIVDNPPRFQGAEGRVAAVSAPSERACSRDAEAWLDAELTVRDRIVPTPLLWLVGGGFVLVRDGRVRGRA